MSRHVHVTMSSCKVQRRLAGKLSYFFIEKGLFYVRILFAEKLTCKFKFLYRTASIQDFILTLFGNSKER